MPRLSIVIACPDETDVFETTLASVLQHRPEDCEVIVVHPFAYADPYELAGEVCFVNGGSTAGMLELLNIGLRDARGEVIHFLEPGTQVAEGWADPALACFSARSDVAAVTPLVVQVDDRRRIAYTGIGQGLAGRRILCGVGQALPRTSQKPREPREMAGPSLHAAFYRAAPLRDLGGFDADIGYPAADLDLALSIRQLGLECALVAESVVVSPVPPRHNRLCFATGRSSEQMYWRHATAGPSAVRLIARPLTIALEFLVNLPRGGAIGNFGGRVAGFMDSAGYRRYQQRMQRMQSAAGVLRLDSDEPRRSACHPGATPTGTSTEPRALTDLEDGEPPRNQAA